MAFDKVKYDNQYAKNNYDRIPINVPKGKKAEIESHAKKKGYKSVTAYVVDLIDQDMSKVSHGTVESVKLGDVKQIRVKTITADAFKKTKENNVG